MSRLYSFLMVTLLALALVACGAADTTPTSQSGSGSAGSDLRIVATTAQIGALVKEVAGDAAHLHILMPPGVDPHDFEVTPADLRALSDADLILRNGIGLDDFLDANIKSAGGDGDVVTVTDSIQLLAGGHDDHDQEHDHGDYDPHVWHDPANVKIMVDNIVAALSAVDSGNAATYQEHGEAYKAVLDETDAEIRAMFAGIPPENRKLVTVHDAFGYFIHAYDLEFVGAVVPAMSTDAEPSAQALAELSRVIKDEHVKAIFAEDTVDPKIAEQLARDTGVEIVYGLHSDSLGEPGSGADTIHGMLLANATLISEALK